MLGRPSRQLWIAAIVIALVCVGGLGYALMTDWDTPPDRSLEPAQREVTSGRSGGGFGLGVLLGIGAGIVIGALIAQRKRES